MTNTIHRLSSFLLLTINIQTNNSRKLHQFVTQSTIIVIEKWVIQSLYSITINLHNCETDFVTKQNGLRPVWLWLRQLFAYADLDYAIDIIYRTIVITLFDKQN